MIRHTTDRSPGGNALEAQRQLGCGALARLLALVVCAFGVVGCQKPFDVNVATEKPLKIDLSMDVHVYQHGGSSASATAVQSNESGSAASSGSANGADKKKNDPEVANYLKVMERRRNRMAEIQNLKNNRFVGENRFGLLSLRTMPEGEGWDSQYIKKTLAEENDDRTFLIEHEALKKEKSIEQIQAQQWQHAQRKAHPGEWIESPVENQPGVFQWVQKETPTGE